MAVVRANECALFSRPGTSDMDNPSVDFRSGIIRKLIGDVDLADWGTYRPGTRRKIARESGFPAQPAYQENCRLPSHPLLQRKEGRTDRKIRSMRQASGCVGTLIRIWGDMIRRVREQMNILRRPIGYRMR